MPKNSLTSSTTDSPAPLTRFSDLRQAEWNGLARTTGPFADWRFLASLEDAACIGRTCGWEPCLPVIRDDGDGRLRAAAPSFLKKNSHGEFVFDWAWAHASQSAGMPWYPKLLVAAPFSPVPGPRLLGAESDREAALALVEQIEGLVHDRALSSAGVNFCDEHDASVLREAGWLERFDWQFHWHNPGYRDFDDFLDCLKRKPRKNIRAERRRVREDGWRFEWKDGTEMGEADLDLADRCYQSTFALYGNLPMLNRRFFELCAQRFGEQFLMCTASLDNEMLAAAIYWRDDTRLYGRYWGSLVETKDVHFETCFYRGIDYCIRHGLQWFEPGAQGEHKIRRGFLPQKTHSFHFIRHAGMRRAIADWLQHEARALQEYRRYLDTLDPFAR